MADPADLEPREGGGRGVRFVSPPAFSLLCVFFFFFFLPKIRGKRPACPPSHPKTPLQNVPLSKALRCLRSNLLKNSFSFKF